jgi:hypothetical protein
MYHPLGPDKRGILAWWRDNWGGVFATLIAIWLGLSLDLLFRFLDRKKMRVVFGDDILSGDGKVILAALEGKNVIASTGESWQEPVAGISDLNAAVDVANIKDLKRSLEIVLDSADGERAVKVDDQTMVIVGMQTNRCFRKFRFEGTDLFAWDRDSRSLTLGKSSGGSFRPTDESDVAIIARLRPKQHAGRVWILCAGIGREGTRGAAWFLANKWRELYDRLEETSGGPESMRFAAIIRVSNDREQSGVIEDFVAL